MTKLSFYRKQSYLLATLAAALVLTTLAIYLPARQNEFLNWDDRSYVTENDHVKVGITGQGIIWAFSESHSGNWHPLTWLSHMLDCQLFSLDPAAHHMTNVWLHAVNAALLLLLLHQLTGSLWRSISVAALFALHPLRVESVAWVSERKDLLSAFFGILTLMAYVRFTQCKVKNEKLQLVWYGVALGLFALGLMSKPMLVTWPFVMLLLDWGPLDRIRTSRAGAESGKTRAHWDLLTEKIPFFALVLGSVVITLWAQQKSGAVASLESLPLSLRLQNTAVAYVAYLGKFLWPTNLSPIYPHAKHLADWMVLGALLILVAVCAVAWQLRKRQPLVLLGWLWFLGTLIPVIGIVQVGSQAMADRYTYLPMIGIATAIVWLGADWLACAKLSRNVAFAFILGILTALAWQTQKQISHWKNNETLFRHTLQLYPHAAQARYGLGSHLVEQGQLEEGRQHLEEAIKLQPRFTEAIGTLGLSYDNEGKYAEAARYYEAALATQPDHVTILNNLAWLRAACPDASLRSGPTAVRLATQACELTDYSKPILIGTLAAAQAETGDVSAASTSAARAATLAEKMGLKETAARNRELLELYRQGKAAHGGAPTNN